MNMKGLIPWRNFTKCRYCKMSFSRASDKTKHGRIHTKEKPYQCKYCEMSFSQTSHMKEFIPKRNPINVDIAPSISRMHVTWLNMKGPIPKRNRINVNIARWVSHSQVTRLYMKGRIPKRNRINVNIARWVSHSQVTRLYMKGYIRYQRDRRDPM